MSKRKYTIEQFIDSVNKNYSMRATLLDLNLVPTGGNYELAYLRIKRLNLDTSHWKGRGWSKGKENPTGTKRNVQEYLKKDGPYIGSNRLRIRLIKEKLLDYKCNICGIYEWCNKSLTLQLEHKDGNKFNNEITNLCLLCPNCHSQTKTFAGRNKGKYKSKYLN